MQKLLNKLMSFDICVSLRCGNEITNFFLHNSHFSLNFTSKRRRAKRNEKEIKCKWSMPVCAIFRVFVLCTSLYRHIILNAELGQTAHSLLLHMPFAYGFLFKGPQFWFKCMWFCGTFKQTTTLVSNMQLIYHGDRCHASRIRNLHLGFKSCWHFTTTFIRATFPANFSRFIIEFVRFLHRRVRTDQNPGKIKKIKKRKNLKICETFFNKLGKCLSRTSKVRIY